MSMPREHRLRKHAEFELVYRSGRRHFSQILTAFYLLRAGDRAAGQGPRVGITVGKALGKATTRNRIKRRVRATVTENLNHLTSDVDVVINPKKAAFDIEFAQLANEVVRAFDVIQQKAAVAKEQSVPSAVADGS